VVLGSAAEHVPPFTEEHEQFRTAVRRFVATELRPHAAEWDEAAMVPRAEARRRANEGQLSRDTVEGEDRAREPLAVDRTRFHLVTDTAVADVEIPLAGRHNVANALAASAAAMAIGIDLKTVAEGLKQVVPPPMRLAAERLVNGVALVNDAYNANPSSLRAAVDAMADVVPERLIVVWGEMLELGEHSGELHEAAGRHVGGVRPVLLCALGVHARELFDGAVAGGLAREKAVIVDSLEAAADAVAAAWRTGDLVLVKGSRGAQMERVVEALRRRVAA
jgi:UDP-N-acetylmuramoyl-tripeptide--D-alanyl-D-alanine ligase